MLISSTQEIPGKTIVEFFGVVSGSTVRAKHTGRDIAVGLKNMVGGELGKELQPPLGPRAKVSRAVMDGPGGGRNVGLGTSKRDRMEWARWGLRYADETPGCVEGRQELRGLEIAEEGDSCARAGSQSPNSSGNDWSKTKSGTGSASEESTAGV